MIKFFSNFDMLNFMIKLIVIILGSEGVHLLHQINTLISLGLEFQV